MKPLLWRNNTRAMLLCVAFSSLLTLFLQTCITTTHADSIPHTSRTWIAQVGMQNADAAIQDVAIMPREMWINVGDTVIWTTGSEALQTITFLPPKTAEPLFSFASHQIMPVGGTHYDGESYYNSGLLSMMPDMNGMSYVRQYRLTFDVSGTFSYYNLPYLDAKATIHVRPVETPYPHMQPFYNHQVQQEQEQMLHIGHHLAAKALHLSDRDTDLIVAGIDQGTVTLMRFYPAHKIIHVGETITFMNDANEPHTVTFGPPPSSLAQVFRPYGNPKGYDGSSPLNSGLIGANPRGNPSTVVSFSVSFSQPGVYSYACIPHDAMGMKGTITVVSS